MEPAEENPYSVTIQWNAGHKNGGRTFNNFLLGASWAHHHTFPVRFVHLYLGLWTLSIRKQK